MKKPGFTLVEMLVTVALTGVILTSGYAAFQSVMRAQSRLAATIDVQRNLFYISEKIGHLIRSGGTIDYEEYFNRRILGYNQDTNSEGVFTFEKISKFGNAGTLYFCSAGTGENNYDPNDQEKCLTNYYETTPAVTAAKPLVGHQTYGQYQRFSVDQDSTLGYPVPIPLPPIFKKNDTVKIYSLTNAIPETLEDTTTSSVGLPELYLIREEPSGNMVRTYFRHVYITDENAPGACNPTSSLKDCRGKIQMTQLQSCDITPEDGVIDAWIPATIFSSNSAVACPKKEAEISDAADSLIWLDITSPDLDVMRAAFFPYPHQIPELMRLGTNTSPRVTLRLDIRLSERLARRGALAPGENQPRIIMTTYELTQ